MIITICFQWKNWNETFWFCRRGANWRLQDLHRAGTVPALHSCWPSSPGSLCSWGRKAGTACWPGSVLLTSPLLWPHSFSFWVLQDLLRWMFTFCAWSAVIKFCRQTLLLHAASQTPLCAAGQSCFNWPCAQWDCSYSHIPSDIWENSPTDQSKALLSLPKPGPRSHFCIRCQRGLMHLCLICGEQSSSLRSADMTMNTSKSKKLLYFRE